MNEFPYVTALPAAQFSSDGT